MYLSRIVAVMLLFLATSSPGQHHQITVTSSDTNDSLESVLHRHGIFEGHFRSHTMATINHSHQPDYFAQGIGGGLRYYTPVIKRFQLALSGFVIYNAHSSGLALENGYTNRYEVALFDITDPENREDLDRMENLYLRYYLDQGLTSFLQAGKFQLTTPLLNMQDSRMRPNLQEGVWTEINLSKKIQVKGGWLWANSPRSTVRWYGIGESVGIYGNGKAIDGSIAKYSGHVQSDGIAIGNVSLALNRLLTWEVWNYYAESLFNSVLSKAEVRNPIRNSILFAGVQHIWQRSLSSPDVDVEHRYIEPDEKSHVISLRAGITRPLSKQTWTLNYTRITAHGRFLFPREWGTETLYTYISRERTEGSGDVHAWMIQNTRLYGTADRFSIQSLVGITKMPAVQYYRLNKYSVPSYYHIALKGGLRFQGLLKGLEAHALYVYKGSAMSDALEEQYLHNKAKMHHAALVLDYHF